MSDNNATPDSQIIVMPQPSVSIEPQRSSVGRLIRRTIFDLNEQELSRLKLMAQMYSASAFNHKKDQKEGDFFLIMLKGLELGIAPMAAVDTINIIAGKPVLDAKGQLALVKSSGLLEDIQIDSTSERCIVTIKRFGEDSAHIVSFTIQDANTFMTMEWVDGSKKQIPLSQKSNWKSQPAVMLKWRAVTAALREVFPDVINGLYNPEELDTDNVIVGDDGSMDYKPADKAKALPSGQVSDGAKTPEKKAEESAIKAWHEDPKNLALLLGNCVAKGWIEGANIGEQKASFLSLVGKEVTSFETGKAANDAAEEAAGKQSIKNKDEAKESSAAKSSKPAPSGKTELSEKDLAALQDWAMVNFGMSAEKLTEKGDLHMYQTLGFARAGIMGKAKKELWPVIAERVEHVVKDKGVYLEFETAAGMMRLYSREKFKGMVGEEYFAENGIADLPDNEAQDIEPVTLFWQAKEGYNIVTDAAPVPELTLA